MHTDAATACVFLAVALLIDGCYGEYPALLHPVVWMGKTISACLRLAPASGWYRQFVFGALLTLLIVALSGGLAWLILQAASVHYLAEILTGSLLLKAT